MIFSLSTEKNENRGSRLNPQAEVVNQVEARCAIALIMDRSLLKERVLPGQAEPIYSLIPTFFLLMNPPLRSKNNFKLSFIKHQLAVNRQVLIFLL